VPSRGGGFAAGVYAVVALLGLAARLTLAATSPAGAEIGYYSQVAGALSRGEGAYATSLNNYSPIWSGVIRLVDRASRDSGISFVLLMRMLVIAVDLVSAAVLWRLARRRGGDPWRVVALFLANPVSIWVTGFQGQFDGVSLVFLLLAILVTGEGVGTASGKPPAWIFLALSIATKQITALHPILWMKRFHNRATVLLPWVLTALLFVPFAREWRSIRDNVLLYRGVPRSYGLSELVLFDERWGTVVGLLALAAGLVTAWRLRDEPDLVRASLVLFLVLLVFAPGFGTQYAVWPLTLGVLTAGAGYFLCTVATMAWTLGSHYGVPGSGRWMGHVVWLSFVFWLVRETTPASRVAPRRIAAQGS
jgi:hypothetical protein